MTPPRRRGRPIPPKSGRNRPASPSNPGRPAGAAGPQDDGPDEYVSSDPASATPSTTPRPLTRAQNRAAKRAATGVRPKAVRGGRVQGRSSRGYNPVVVAAAAVAAIVVVGVLAAGAGVFGPGASPSPSAAAARTPLPSGVPFGDGTCPTEQPDPLAAGDDKLVTITTALGDIVIRVDADLSPIAAGNFVALAECEYYDGVPFHRAAALQSGTPFVIQGGDGRNFNGTGGPGYTIEDEEVTADYHRGTVAMARTSQPNSQGSQFFIVLSEEAAVPLADANTYAIFGEVVEGMDVADAIYNARGGVDLPVDPVEMDLVTVEDAPAASASPGASTAPSGAASPAASTAP